MSFLTKIFGGGSKSPSNKKEVPTTNEAIQRLRNCEELLYKRQEHIEKLIEQQENIARQNGMKNKRTSLQALRKKKRLEKQLEQIDGTLTTIEFQREALENANTNAEVLNILNYAGKALKQTHNNLDIDKVEDLMDEVKEQQQIAEEISNVISNPISFGQDVDEDELLKELEEMEQQELDRQLLDAEPATSLPEVPSTKLPSKATASTSKVDEIEKEMEELRRFAST